MDFLLTAKRDLEAAKRFFRKMLEESRSSHPTGSAPMRQAPTRRPSQRPGRLVCWRAPVHYVTKHLQQGIESDHFRVKKPMPWIGGFQSFHTARRTIQGSRRCCGCARGSALRALDGVRAEPAARGSASVFRG